MVREGDTYYLSGEKHLITFGTIADYLLTFARVEGTRGTDGTVALMVPSHGEGIDNREMAETMGVRGTDHGHIVFDRAPVPVADRFGEEGQGVDIALSGFLGPSRISVAMTCVGLAQRALDLALDYARQRETFGKKIAERQAIAFKLAEMATDVEAARRLVWHAASTWEQRGHAPMEAAMAKLFAVTCSSASPTRRCRCTAASATGRPARSSASTATPARSASRRAPTRSRRPRSRETC